MPATLTIDKSSLVWFFVTDKATSEVFSEYSSVSFILFLSSSKFKFKAQKKISFPLNVIQWTTNEPHWIEFEWLWQWQVYIAKTKGSEFANSVHRQKIEIYYFECRNKYIYRWTIIHWCELTRETHLQHIHAHSNIQTNFEHTHTYKHTHPRSFHQFCDAMWNRRKHRRMDLVTIMLMFIFMFVQLCIGKWMQLINTLCLYPAVFSQLLLVVDL